MQPLVLSYRPRYIHEYCFEIIKMGYQCSQWWSGTDTRYTVDYYEGYPRSYLNFSENKLPLDQISKVKNYLITQEGLWETITDYVYQHCRPDITLVPIVYSAITLNYTKLSKFDVDKLIRLCVFFNDPYSEM